MPVYVLIIPPVGFFDAAINLMAKYGMMPAKSGSMAKTAAPYGEEASMLLAIAIPLTAWYKISIA